MRAVSAHPPLAASTVFRAPMACAVTPTARVVAYGTRLTVATRTAHYDGRAFGATSGAWKVAPGGLAMTSTAVVTSATGETTKAIQVLRTTKVAFVVPASSGTTGCSTTVAYSVRGVGKLASSASTARRSTYLTMTATQAPHIAGQPIDVATALRIHLGDGREGTDDERRHGPLVGEAAQHRRLHVIPGRVGDHRCSAERHQPHGPRARGVSRARDRFRSLDS